MDVNDLRALLTLVMFVIFLAIVMWAYSGANRERFDEAARLPLDDDRYVGELDSRAEGGRR